MIYKINNIPLIRKFCMPLLVSAYVLAATLLHLFLTYEWMRSGDMYAEMATNYYSVAASGASLISQLLATDHGYISPMLRIGPYIANQLKLGNQGFVYLFGLISYVLVVITPSMLISKRFNAIHPSYLIRALCALAISSMFNFESRTYINSSYVFIAIIFVLALNYYKGGKLNYFDFFIIVLIILAKPLTIALLPLLLLNATKGRDKLFFVFITLLLIINIALIRSNSEGLLPNIDIVQAIGNIVILTFYNIGKVFLFYVPPIAIKIDGGDYASILSVITAFIGLLLTYLCLGHLKTIEAKRLLLTVIFINILWATLIVIAIGASAPISNKINSDFNRYDLITAINLLTLVSLSKDFWIKNIGKILIPLILISAITIFSSASIFYFTNHIKKNILYIGTSTWAQMKDRPEFLGCALISPLGWGYNCKVTTNIINRQYIPFLMNFNKEISIEIPKEMRDGFLTIFSKEKTHNNQIEVIGQLDKISTGENFDLAFNRNAIVYKINCAKDIAIICTQNLILNNVELYAIPGSNGTPLIALFNKQ
jgi:hypothetical protein